MEFKHLAQVHSARHTKRIEHNVNRGAVRQERHIFFREYAGDNTFIPVPPGEFIALGDLTVLRNINADHLVDAGRQLIAFLLGFFLGNLFNGDHSTAFTMRHPQGGIANFAALLAKDCTQQALFRGKLGLALRRYFAYENIAGLDFSADPDDPALVKVSNRILRNVGKVAGDLFSTKLGFAGIDLELFNMDRAQRIIAYQTLRDDHSIFVVITVPRHKSNEEVLAQRHLTLVSSRAVSKHRAFLHALTLSNQRYLVVAGHLV